MKYLLRYSCVLLCCVLLLTAFSLNVSAEETQGLKDYTVFICYGPDYNSGIFVDANPFDSVDQSVQANDYTYMSANTNHTFTMHYTIKSKDIPIITKGPNVELTFTDVFFRIGVKSTYDNSFVYATPVTNIRLLLTFTDNTQKYIDTSYTVYNYQYNITSKFTPEKDIKEIEYIFNCSYGSGNRAKYLTYYVGEYGSSTTPYRVMYSQDKEEMGLLRNISNFIVGIFNSIAELPSKIWSLIENGLKSLFVPSDDYITNFKNDMESMLEEKLGAVYQVIDISLNSWDRITDNSTKGVVNIPSVSIPLPSSETFTFGGYDVKIVPDNFEILANAVKLITGILATLFFVNGLRKKYDEVMGVEQ